MSTASDNPATGDRSDDVSGSEEESDPDAQPDSPARARPALEVSKGSADESRLWLRLSTWGKFLAKAYASADPRSLGLFRIALGTLLFVDVARRLPDLTAHYTNAGWLTNHFALFRPMSSHIFSIYHAFSTPEEVRVMVGLHLLVNFLVIIGFHTRLMLVLAAIFITSINSRNILLENGGWVVLNLLTVWSMFLPLGRRFSVDALRRSFAYRERDAEALNDRSIPVRDRAPVLSLAVTALLLQWVVIYYFNVIHKNGTPWRDGTAVYYFFQQDRMVTSLGAWMRDSMPFWVFQSMTWGTLVIEATIVVLLLFPFATKYTRMVAWLFCAALHLTIDAVVQLGPFSWAMVVMFVALIPSEAWEAAARHRAAKKPARRLLFDPDSGVSLYFCRVIKRFDTLGLVTFVALPRGSREPDPDSTEPETIASRAAERTLIVTDAENRQHWTGVEALRRLFDALPVFPVLFGWISWPIVGSLIDALLTRVFTGRAELSRYLQIDNEPKLPSGSPPPPPPARQLALRVGGMSAHVVLLLMMIAGASQVLIENRAVPERFKPHKRPEWMTSVIVYPRLFQGWSMFAPAPPMEDGRIVIDGRTADGRHFDPLTGQTPTFEVQPKGGFRMNQIWGDFHRRIGEQRFSVYHDGVRDFLLNHHEITQRPQDRLVAFDVWYVSEQIPPPGKLKPAPTRHRLFSHGVVN
jgi:hypothetical protein